MMGEEKANMLKEMGTTKVMHGMKIQREADSIGNCRKNGHLFQIMARMCMYALILVGSNA